jgi:hypothetical protein
MRCRARGLATVLPHPCFPGLGRAAAPLLSRRPSSWRSPQSPLAALTPLAPASPRLPRLRAAAAEVAELWREYEAQATPESHMVKDFDKLEMIIQVGWRGVRRRGRPATWPPA